MSEADDRYRAEIIEDCERILGYGIELVAFEREDDGEVRLIARYRLDDTDWESTGTGDTVIAAHADLRACLVADRLRLGFTAYVDPDARQARPGPSSASVAASATPSK